MSAELERRLQSATGSVDVVERLVFHLYERLDSRSPTRSRKGRSRAARGSSCRRRRPSTDGDIAGGEPSPAPSFPSRY
jgi:hypothetical protein